MAALQSRASGVTVAGLALIPLLCLGAKIVLAALLVGVVCLVVYFVFQATK
jgi:hypothetical protein